MFESLTEKLNAVFKRLRGKGRLDAGDVDEALKQVRLALLEADVHFKVAKDFIEGVRGRAIGQEILSSLTPAQQVIKIVHEELTRLMGGEAVGLNLRGSPPLTFMLVGLQGSGKTTTAAKLARHLKRMGRRPLLVCADVKRPAGHLQLKRLGEQVEVATYEGAIDSDPLNYCLQALSFSRRQGYDSIILDTAGRLAVEDDLMEELKGIKEGVRPQETLLVADGMTGQDAVNLGRVFNQSLGIDGVILTKMDGDARGGAALSIKAVTGRPVKFLGVGEKIDGLEPFHPDRMAQRILGMGDVLSLIEKAEALYDQERAREIEKKIRRESFTLEDFRDQVRQIRRMGSIEELLSMIPGVGKLTKIQGIRPDDRQLIRVEAIINSMTKRERANYLIIDGSRRRRIARGSGTTVAEVNQVIRRFAEMKKMMKRLSQKKGRFHF